MRKSTENRDLLWKTFKKKEEKEEEEEKTN